MRVYVDGTIFSNQTHGGISRIFQQILPRMCDLMHDLDIDLWSWQYLQQRAPEHPHITHHRLHRFHVNRRRPRRLWRYLDGPAYHLTDIIRKRRLRASPHTIWHATYYWLPQQWEGPILFHIYDMKEERFVEQSIRRNQQILRAQKRQGAQQADKIICISESTRQDVLEYLDVTPSKVEVVPLGVDPIFRRLEANEILENTTEPFLLYVGRRGSFKQFEMFLRAYAIWAGRATFRLVAVGGGDWSPAERSFIAESGVVDRVVLHPSVKDETLCLLYNQARAFVFPSLYEGFGIPLLEAMACGCPIVASRIPSSMEVARDSAYFFEPQAPEDLLRALDEAVDAGRDGAVVWRGLQRVQQYSWDISARQTLGVYRSVSM